MAAHKGQLKRYCSLRATTTLTGCLVYMPNVICHADVVAVVAFTRLNVFV